MSTSPYMEGTLLNQPANDSHFELERENTNEYTKTIPSQQQHLDLFSQQHLDLFSQQHLGEGV